MTNVRYHATRQTRLGPIFMLASQEGLHALGFEDAVRASDSNAPADVVSLFDRVAFVLSDGDEHDLPLAPHGTPFQRKVWALLRAIPKGSTRTYGELATDLGMSNGARAVGSANGANPIAVLIPCHRVIASDGTLGGYAYGVEMKRRLLEEEGVVIAADRQPALL